MGSWNEDDGPIPNDPDAPTGWAAVYALGSAILIGILCLARCFG